MFWLHFLNGGRNHRSSIIAITESETPPIVEINIGRSKLINIANNEPETFDIGWKLGPVQTKNSAKRLAYVLARDGNYDVMIDNKAVGLPYASEITKSAATLGSLKSPRKANASRNNGRKGGRPRKI